MIKVFDSPLPYPGMFNRQSEFRSLRIHLLSVYAYRLGLRSRADRLYEMYLAEYDNESKAFKRALGAAHR